MVKEIVQPYQVQLKPSRLLKIFTASTHLLALVAAFTNALPISVKIMIGLFLFVHFAYAWQNADSHRHTLRYTEALGWEIAARKEFCQIDVLTSTVMTTEAIWLHARILSTGGRFSNRLNLLIMKDALGEKDFRSLIVKLKTTCQKGR